MEKEEKVEKKIPYNYRNAGRRKIPEGVRKVSMIPRKKVKEYEEFVKSLQFPNGK